MPPQNKAGNKAKKNASQGRSKAQRAERRKSRALADAELLEALQGLWPLRAPYRELLTEIVGETLAQYVTTTDSPLLEIGAGTGQLRHWLPETFRARVLHTDPSEEALVVLRQQQPGARTAVASAHGLPSASSSCGGVLALCVFDTLYEAAPEEAAVAEIARVLAPGAPFIHFLDMATLLDRPFREFQAQGVVPIPNVFGDPDEHDWPLDIVLFEREWLRQILHFALRIEHPLVTTFGPYFGAFLLEPFDLEQAVRHYKAVATNSGLQQALRLHLAYVIQLAVQQGHPAMAAIPFHSGRYLAELMADSFAKSALFRTAFSGIVARSHWRPPSNGETAGYRSLCLGHQRISTTLPKRLLAESSRHGPADGAAPGELVLTEAGVFVFVAIRN